MKPDADKWVEDRSSRPHGVESVKPNRLTLDMDASLHTELKLYCVRNDMQNAEFLRGLIRKELVSAKEGTPHRQCAADESNLLASVERRPVSRGRKLRILAPQ